MSNALEHVHRSVEARLEFARSPQGESYLADQYIAYPLHITRPFYLEGDPEGMATVYLQSVSGGIFAGDVVNLTITAAEQVHAQVTTQASTIAHTMPPQTEATQSIRIRAEPGAFIEYLADPIVLFPQTRLNARVVIDAAPDATVIVTDAFINHDPGGGVSVFDRFRNELSIWRGSKLRCMDRFDVNGATFRQHLPLSAHGTLVAVTDARVAQLQMRLNQVLASHEAVFAGVSSLPDDAGVWVRLLAPDSHLLRVALLDCWSGVRQELTGHFPRERRK